MIRFSSSYDSKILSSRAIGINFSFLNCLDNFANEDASFTNFGSALASQAANTSVAFSSASSQVLPNVTQPGRSGNSTSIAFFAMFKKLHNNISLFFLQFCCFQDIFCCTNWNITFVARHRNRWISMFNPNVMFSTGSFYKTGIMKYFFNFTFSHLNYILVCNELIYTVFLAFSREKYHTIEMRD